MFLDVLEKYDWNKIKQDIYSKTEKDVLLALNKPKRDLEDFKTLVSPAAFPYLEQMAKLSNKLTQKRFGKIIQLFIPLYLSNYCVNECVYCGFNCHNDIERIILDEEQILNEVEAIKSYGFEHILLVTGEAPSIAGMEYFERVIKLIKPYFALISMEVQPLEASEYIKLKKLGLNTVYIYQETYNKESYKKFHGKTKKSDFAYRLHTPDRLGKAEMHRIGIASLLGLEDWRTDAFFTALHLKYLEKKYWKSKCSISFPRLRPHKGSFKPEFSISDAELVQLITAYRIFDEEVELSISVRESRKFRDNVVKLGITSMSAGSKTKPGAYALNYNALEQFEVFDDRTPSEVVDMIKSKGYEPVWKDWGYYMQL